MTTRWISLVPSLAMKTLDLARPMVAAMAVGICQRAVDEAVAYAKQRVTFGKPIAKHQAIQQRPPR